MADIERRLIGWVARHSAYTVLLATIFGAAAASAVAYLWLARSANPELPPVARRVAQLASADGPICIRRADSNEFIPAGEGVLLGPGDALQAGDGGSAVLQFDDGSSYRLDSGTTLVLRETHTPSVTAASAALLQEGRVAPLRSPRPAPVTPPTDLLTSTGDATGVSRRILLGSNPTAPRPRPSAQEVDRKTR